MKPDSTQRVKELAFLLAEIQKHTYGLSGDAGEITYLFFAARLSIAEIFEICELPASEVNRTISDFLVGLFTKSKRFQEFLSRPPAIDERTGEICTERDRVMAELKEGKADSLIASCKTPDSLGGRVRDVVGTAIRIGMPAASTNFTPESVSKMGIATKICKAPSAKGDRIRGMVGTTILIGMPAASTNFTPESVSKMGIAAKICKALSAKFSVELREQNFFLGYLKKSAGAKVSQAPKTCSDGTVLIKRGLEKVQVDFHVALQEKTATEEKPKYMVTFHNLPSWAAPASFSFVGPDDLGNVKEYKLPSEFFEGRLYFEVENEEQEIAFLDRTKTYIGFIISRSSKK